MKADSGAHNQMKELYDAAAQRLGDAEAIETPTGVKIARAMGGNLALAHTVTYEGRPINATTTIDYPDGRDGFPVVITRFAGTEHSVGPLKSSAYQWARVAEQFQELLAEPESPTVIDLRSTAEAQADTVQ